MQETTLYPPSPTHVPVALTQLTGKYRFQVGLSLLGVILFFAFYFALLALTIWLVWLSFTSDWIEITGLWSFLLKAASIAIPLMFFIFTLKFLFKGSSRENDMQLELKPEDHPQLFAFLERLSSEVGALMPKKVVVDPTINAAVYYNSRSPLSVLWPVRKNLLIGMGLANSLNLSEFKAVLAHEFGHFAQSSMKVGSYVYIANKIIHDMVYTRDNWDEVIHKWKQADLRLSFAAWIVDALVWTVRRIMQAFLRLINLLHASLSRQMEFNADLVAVSVTGSNAIVDALYNLEAASDAMGHLIYYTNQMAEEQIYCEDIFALHQALLAQEQHKMEPLPTGLRFDPEHPHALPDMYASHPASHLREQNAKAHMVEGIVDTRSPWELFGAKGTHIREQLSRRIYKAHYGIDFDQPLAPKEEVLNLLLEEKAAQTHPARYHDLYELHTPNMTLSQPTQQGPPPTAEEYNILYGPAIKKLVTNWKRLVQEAAALDSVLHGATRLRQLRFRGTDYPTSKAMEFRDQVEGELEALQAEALAFDQYMIDFHSRIAAQQSGDSPEWHARWTFHLQLVTWIDEHTRLTQAFNHIIGRAYREQEMTQTKANNYRIELGDIGHDYNRLLETCSTLTMPLGASSLMAAIGSPDMVPAIGPTLNLSWINEFASVLSRDKSKIVPIYHRNLGTVLRLQEDMVATYLNGTALA